MKLIEKIEERIRAVSGHDPNVVERPMATLWPDPSGEWAAAAASLGKRTTVLTLGEYDPEQESGPAVWLRCAVRETNLSDTGETPIVYLPGVRREDLEDVADCPERIAPLAGLQFRSSWFVGGNGRAWTVASFFRNTKLGLGLSVPDDSETQDELLSALKQAVELEFEAVSNRVLDANFFRGLVAPDTVRSLLKWIDDPQALRDGLEPAEWAAFTKDAVADYGIDPDGSTPINGAELLGRREGKWKEVWQRFVDQQSRFPNVPDRLRQARPLELFGAPGTGTWPQDNEEAEAALETKLQGVAVLSSSEARGKVLEAWEEHQQRVGWVWTEMGLSPYLESLSHLAELASETGTVLGGNTVEEIQTSYSERGWKADSAFILALKHAKGQKERAIIAEAATPIYLPWMKDGANALQNAVGPEANSGNYEASAGPEFLPGTCVVFVDGLRFDMGKAVFDRLSAAGFGGEVTSSLSALPTVTPTAKFALAPNARTEFKGGTGLNTVKRASGAKATAESIRAILKDAGVAVLLGRDTGTDQSGTAWTECAKIDERGHSDGLDMVDSVDYEIDRIVKRVTDLIEAGWARVEIVTDHGWILVPQALPTSKLEIGAVEARKGRCARVKAGGKVDVPTVPWFWDPDVRIAIAPGVSCFEAGQLYEHGGVSPQECVVPRVTVVPESHEVGELGEITEVKWVGLICRVGFSGVPAGSRLDIRKAPGDPTTSIAEVARETNSEGRAALMIPDEDLEGQIVHIVITDAEKGVLAQRKVTVGGST